MVSYLGNMAVIRTIVKRAIKNLTVLSLLKSVFFFPDLANKLVYFIQAKLTIKLFFKCPDIKGQAQCKNNRRVLAGFRNRLKNQPIA